MSTVEEKTQATLDSIAGIEVLFTQFLETAKQGLPGVKKAATSARDARKISGDIAKQLKAYRATSVALFKKEA